MKIHSYINNSGKDLVLEYIDSLQTEEWMGKTYIYCMPVKNKKIRQRKRIKR